MRFYQDELKKSNSLQQTHCTVHSLVYYVVILRYTSCAQQAHSLLLRIYIKYLNTAICTHITSNRSYPNVSKAFFLIITISPLYYTLNIHMYTPPYYHIFGQQPKKMPVLDGQQSPTMPSASQPLFALQAGFTPLSAGLGVLL